MTDDKLESIVKAMDANKEKMKMYCDEYNDKLWDMHIEDIVSELKNIVTSKGSIEDNPNLFKLLQNKIPEFILYSGGYEDRNYHYIPSIHMFYLIRIKMFIDGFELGRSRVVLNNKKEVE